MLEVQDLHFDYADKAVLHKVRFQLEAGQLLHLCGQNGSGKTTLLKLLAGLLSPSQGAVRYHGYDISNDVACYQQKICYVGHKTGVSQALTIREQCRFDLRRSPSSVPFDELIERFLLTGLEDVLCGQLSAGQRRRVGLLKILMSDAPLWLLDEPLVALDHASLAVLVDCFSSHLDKGGQIVLTSHQKVPLEDRICQEYHL